MTRSVDYILILMVWAKAEVIPGEPPSEWRRDPFGTLIRFNDYKDRSSLYGWDIDHIVPRMLGGSDDLSNLRPLHAARNVAPIRPPKLRSDTGYSAR